MATNSKRKPSWLLVTGVLFGALVGPAFLPIDEMAYRVIAGGILGLFLGIAGDIYFSHMRWDRD